MEPPSTEFTKEGHSMQTSQDPEIRYDPVPGYRPAFFGMLLLAAAYLAYLFL